MTRDGAQAMAWAKAQTYYQPGMCQAFVHTAFDIGAGFGSARAAWVGAKRKHSANQGSQIPAGVPVYWLGGSRGYGHTTVSLGNGLCRSTDWPSEGRVGTARIDDISRLWGETLVGWAEDINGVSIPGAGNNQQVPSLDLSNVVYCTVHAQALPHGYLLKAAVAAEVGRGKMNLASPVLGVNFKAQYVLVQKKCGATNAQADGIPGKASLSWLGSRHGFTVVP